MTNRGNKRRPPGGGYAKGRERLVGILEAVLAVLIDDGYSRLTMRRIAARANITVGNLHYYYPSKKDLLRDLLDHVIDGYIDEFERIRARIGNAPTAELVAICEYIITDLNSRRTTMFFPELWAMSNHDPYAARLMDALYQKARLVLNELIAKLNTTLTAAEREHVALFMSASMEGLTMFLGHRKPWARALPKVRAVAIRAFLHAVTTTRGSRRVRGKTRQPSSISRERRS